MWPNMERIDNGISLDSANISTATAIAAAVAGKRLAPEYLKISVVAAAGAAPKVQLQDDAGTPNVIMGDMGFPAAGGTLILAFTPAEAAAYKLNAGAVPKLISSTTDTVSVESRWYVFET